MSISVLFVLSVICHRHFHYLGLYIHKGFLVNFLDNLVPVQ